MLLKLVGKLLFKLSVPVLFVATIASIALHFIGGDPAAWWKGVGSRAVGQTAGMLTNAKDDASKVARSVVNRAKGTVGEGASASEPTQVFMWKDSNGTTHFSNVSIDKGAGAVPIEIDPDRNVLTPNRAYKPATAEKDARVKSRLPVSLESVLSASKASRASKSSDKRYSDAATREVADLLGGELPGVAGQKSPFPEGIDAGLNPAQLLKLLQQ